MNYIRLTAENIDREHICCAISGERDPQVMAKKAWLRERLPEGLTFLRADARGKCFIEYLPAEYAWVPVEADGYMMIDCFWVSGSLKGHGYADELLAECIRDSRERGKKGLCVISSRSKKPFLSDPKYLAHRGFLKADEAAPFYELLYLPFEAGVPAPRFADTARAPGIEEQGLVMYYTAQCPYTAKYVPLLEALARKLGAPVSVHPILSREEARRAPMAWTTFALFEDGEYRTNELQSEKKFAAICEAYLQKHS